MKDPNAEQLEDLDRIEREDWEAHLAEQRALGKDTPGWPRKLRPCRDHLYVRTGRHGLPIPIMCGHCGKPGTQEDYDECTKKLMQK